MMLDINLLFKHKRIKKIEYDNLISDEDSDGIVIELYKKNL